VTRADIVDRLWGKDVFVDVDTGVNTAMRKIRQALHDSPEAPAFIETVPGKGVHLMFLPLDPKWDDYRQDPRFVALLSRCAFVR
jgi:hypothetical protein